jgi:hypothetical protein
MKITPQTVFAWPHREGPSWTLLVLIFAMLLLHSAAFFLFQAGTPEVKPPPRMAPPILVLTPFLPDGTPSPENEALLRWIDSVDPALVGRMPEVTPRNLLEAPYRTSFSTMRTAPLGVPPEAESVQFPPARNPMALILGTPDAAEIPTPKIEPQPTKIAFAPALGGRALESRFSPKGRTNKPLEPTRFLIGVTAEGEVRYVFPQRQDQRETSPLDTEAMDFLATVTFKPAPGQPIAWGLATIEWGDDITAAP